MNLWANQVIGLFFLKANMTKKEMEKLEVGDIVRLKKNPEFAFVVHQNFGDRVTCVRTIEIREPLEWELAWKKKSNE